MEIHTSKTEAIHAFQFIGCQYSHLTDIVHQLNHCYSFQVWFIIFQLSLLTYYQKPSVFYESNQNSQLISDDALHWDKLCKRYFQLVFILQPFDKWRYSEDIMFRSITLGSISFGLNINIYLCCQCCDQRGIHELKK